MCVNTKSQSVTVEMVSGQVFDMFAIMAVSEDGPFLIPAGIHKTQAMHWTDASTSIPLNCKKT